MAASALPPLVVGLFGLGTGYFIWGGSTLSGWPKVKTQEFEKTMGQWGIWMPGFMQFFTGVYLFQVLKLWYAEHSCRSYRKQYSKDYDLLEFYLRP